MLFLFFVLRWLSKGVKLWAVSIGGGEIDPFETTLSARWRANVSCALP